MGSRANAWKHVDVFYPMNFSMWYGNQLQQREDVKGTGKKVVVHGSRKCIHNVRRHHLKMNAPHEGPGRQPGASSSTSSSRSSLHTSNRMRMSLTRMQTDQYPLDSELELIHNHAINSADALRYRPVTEEVKTKFSDLFDQDFTPSAVLTKYKDDLRLSCSADEFTHIIADRSRVPDYFWVFHHYAHYIDQKYGNINGVDAYLKSVEMVKLYNERNGMELVKIAQTEDGETVVAICDIFPVESTTVCHRLETLSSWMQRQTSIVKPQNSSILYVLHQLVVCLWGQLLRREKTKLQ